MPTQLIVGLTHTIQVATQPDHTARQFYPNLPDVFATPFLAGFMERVSAELMDRHLAPGQQSVGVSMNLRHSAATPLGMQVRLTARITAIDGRKVSLSVEAWDDVEQIGQAEHDRYIITAESFNTRVSEKAARLAQ